MIGHGRPIHTIGGGGSGGLGGGNSVSGGSSGNSGSTQQPKTINISTVTFKSSSTMTFNGESVPLPPNASVTVIMNGVKQQFYVTNSPNFAIFKNVTATLNNGKYYLPNWSFQYSGCPSYTASMTNRQLGGTVSQIESGVQIFIEPLPTCFPTGTTIPTTATANIFAPTSVPSGTQFSVTAAQYDQTNTAVTPSNAVLVGLPLNTRIQITYKYPNNTPQTTYLNPMAEAGVYAFTLPAPKNSVTKITKSTSAFINFNVKLSTSFTSNGITYKIPNGDVFTVTIEDQTQLITIGQNNNSTTFNGVQISQINGIWYSPPFSISYGHCPSINFRSVAIGKTYPKTYSTSVGLGSQSCLPAGISVGTTATANIFTSTSVPSGTQFSVTLNGHTQTAISPHYVSFQIPINTTVPFAYQYEGHSVHPDKLLPVSVTGVYGFNLPAPAPPTNYTYLYYLIGGLAAVGAAVGGIAYMKGKVTSGETSKLISLIHKGGKQ
jgi:hypothetical protein